MKRNFSCFALLLMMAFATAQNRGILGKWKTIDDATGKLLSVVEIFESHGKIYGKVIEIFNPKNQRRCENCAGEDKNKPILRLVVIKGLTKDG